MGRPHPVRPLANPLVTKLKHDRKDTAHSDSDVYDTGKAHSIKSGSVQKRNIGNIQLENTYKIEPDGSNQFIAFKVRNAAQEVMDSVLQDKEYDAKTVSALVKVLVEKVKEKTKALKMTRHKIVVHAVVGQKGDQSVKATSRCLWNDKFDSHTSAEYESKHLFALVTVYGVYLE